jgi:hypothetical protein
LIRAPIITASAVLKRLASNQLEIVLRVSPDAPISSGSRLSSREGSIGAPAEWLRLATTKKHTQRLGNVAGNRYCKII